MSTIPELGGGQTPIKMALLESDERRALTVQRPPMGVCAPTAIQFLEIYSNYFLGSRFRGNDGIHERKLNLAKFFLTRHFFARFLIGLFAGY